MLHLTCTTITSVDLAHYGVSHGKDWVSVDCRTTLVYRLGGLSLPRKSVVRLTDHPDMTLDVYRGRKTTIQQQLLFVKHCK